MNIDLQKYSYSFLISPNINYDIELSDVIAEKKVQQGLFNETCANELWRIENRISVFEKYSNLYNLLKEEQFYNAWCLAERIELTISNLLYNFPEEKPIITPILNRIYKLQQLFPYRAFSSTELVVKEFECSICGAKSTPRNRCSHQVRRVYNGEMCCRIVSKADLLAISIVTNPEHKYAVFFPTGTDGKQIDQYDYSVVKGLVSIWNEPFQPWDYSVEISYKPMKGDYKPDSFCPCGSGRYYKDCCMNKPGLRHVHITINPGQKHSDINASTQPHG